FDLVRSHKTPLIEANFDEVENLFRQMESEGERTLRTAGATDKVSYARSVEARFIGQGYETNLPLPDGSFSNLDPEDLRRLFDQAYERLYGRTYPEIPVEFVNFRVRASLPVQALELPRLKGDRGSLHQALKGERLAYSDKKHDFIPFKVYDRYKLSPDATFAGPAIIEERESTVIVGEDATVRIDEYGFLWIEMQAE
ncbi:MAG TPA: hypothetical protein VJ022_00690, partial [Anaerolineales bacterium]|nr:hypothetical protein [Anaerolineales bacterium]